MILTAEQFWQTLPHCCGYPKCDGDLVATEHSKECPLYGKKEMTRFEFADAYAADLTQRLAASETDETLRTQIDELISKLNRSDIRATEAERQLAEVATATEPMACGHPKACWHEGYATTESTEKRHAHCTACARENEWKDNIERREQQLTELRSRQAAEIAAAYEDAAQLIQEKELREMGRGELVYVYTHKQAATALRARTPADAKKALAAQIANNVKETLQRDIEHVIEGPDYGCSCELCTVLRAQIASAEARGRLEEAKQ